MNRTLFIYYGPHFVHASFARVLNADFLPIDFKIGWREKPKFPNKFFGVISSILSLPKEYRIYLCESTYVIPAFSRKLHLLGDGKLFFNIVDDPLVYYLYFKVIKGIKREILLNLLHEVDGFICVGKMEAELLRKLIETNSYIIVEPFIQKNVYSRLEKISPTLESHNILFIANGPDWFYKGVDLLIESFSTAKKEIKDLRLTIVGKWQPKKEWLIEGVNFVGHQPSLEPYIQSSSLYVHLGRGEAFGISVLEAMLGGLPAIVSEWTGAKEVVQNLGSDFISKLNYEDASNKIMKYFDLSLEKKIKLSKKAKSLASKFKEDEKLRSFKEKFYKLLEELK